MRKPDAARTAEPDDTENIREDLSPINRYHVSRFMDQRTIATKARTSSHWTT